MTASDALLDLQGLDTRLDQLRHRRAQLPERVEVARLDAALRRVDGELTHLTDERAGVARELTRLEDEAATVEAKITSEDRRLYGGTVSHAKELQAIQDELAALKRRQSHLEDGALEHMVLLEPLDTQMAQLTAECEATRAERDQHAAALAAAEQVIDAEIGAVVAERDTIVINVPASLLGEYEPLRQRLGGVAIARLEGGSCKGCHLKLSNYELDRIRALAPDTVVHCEECGRILVR
jgi:predicted  nucleic acid-binding Zn-ribbon protein